MKKTEIEVNGFNDENKWPIIKGDKKDKVIVTYRMSKSVEHKSALSVGGWNKIAKKHNKRSPPHRKPHNEVHSSCICRLFAKSQIDQPAVALL